VLKQERLAPVSAELQLAWMMAYNAGFFTDTDPAGVRRILDRLREGLRQSPLALSASREDWSRWLVLRFSGEAEPAP
jgi:F-type H+-transporting ATPase subunit alpha